MTRTSDNFYIKRKQSKVKHRHFTRCDKLESKLCIHLTSKHLEIWDKRKALQREAHGSIERYHCHRCVFVRKSNYTHFPAGLTMKMTQNIYNIPMCFCSFLHKFHSIRFTSVLPCYITRSASSVPQGTII